jgi:hypothetical protein
MKQRIPNTINEFLNEDAIRDKAEEILKQCDKETDSLTKECEKLARKKGYKDLGDYFTKTMDKFDEPNNTKEYEELQDPDLLKIFTEIEDICGKIAKEHGSNEKNIKALQSELYGTMLEGGPYMSIIRHISSLIKL